MTKTTKLVLTTSTLFLALYVGRPETASATTTTTATVQVSASVSAGCTITASPLAFGAYDPFLTNLTTPLDQTTPLTYACTKDVVATISLGSVGARAMTNPLSSVPLSYEIYTSNTYGTAWGTGASSVSVTGTGSSATASMYGRIPAGQKLLVAGTYTQDLTATIEF